MQGLGQGPPCLSVGSSTSPHPVGSRGNAHVAWTLGQGPGMALDRPSG